MRHLEIALVVATMACGSPSTGATVTTSATATAPPAKTGDDARAIYGDGGPR